MVALFVYAIARLLPRGGIREAISFSTYESDADQLCTSIAGIAYYDRKSDLPADRYEQDFVVNTYNGKMSRTGGAGAAYVRVVWEQALVANGLQDALQVVVSCESGRIKRIPDLSQSRHGEEAARKVLDPNADLGSVNWNVPILDGYVGRRVGEQLALTPHDRVMQLARSPEHRRAVLDLSSSQTVCQSQVIQLIQSLDQQELELFLNMSGVAPVYTQAAMEHCAQIIQPGRVLKFLKSSSLKKKRLDKLLPDLAGKLRVDELEEFLGLESVPPDVKAAAVGRLAKEVPGDRICSFLQRPNVSLEYRRRAVGDFVPNLPRNDWLNFLKLDEVDHLFKQKLIRFNADKFSGDEALALLTDPGVPNDCRQVAVSQPGFLGRVDRPQLGPVLQLPLVPPGQKNQLLDRLGPKLTGDDLLAILRSPRVPDECRQHALAFGMKAGRLSGDHLLALLLEKQVPEASKLQILGSPTLAAALPAVQLAPLLRDPRLPAACREKACRNADLVKRIPDSEIVDLLIHNGLSGSCRQAAFAQPGLIARIPADDVAKLLCAESVPPELKEKALSQAEVFKRIRVSHVLPLARNASVPKPCKNRIASAFARKLPAKDVVPFLELPDIDLKTKRDALQSHVPQLTGQQIADLLRSGNVPKQCKAEVTSSLDLLSKALELDVVALLRQDVVPTDQKNRLLSRLADKISADDLRTVLLDPKVPEGCKRHILAGRPLAGKLSSPQLLNLLLDDGLPEAGKLQILAGEDLAARLPAGQLVPLLQYEKISTACKEAACKNSALVSRIPGDQFGALLVNTALAESCRETLFEHAIDAGRVPVSNILQALDHPNLPGACRQLVFNRDDLLQELNGDQLVGLLQHPGLSDDMKEHAFRRPAVLEKIPSQRIVALLLDGSSLPSCQEIALRDAALAKRIPDSQISALLVHPKLPPASRQAAFDQPGLITRLPAKHIAELLCAESVPPAMKEKVLDCSQVLQRIPVSDVLSLLQSHLVPESCRRRIASAFAGKLRVEDVAAFVNLPIVELGSKRRALESHASRLTSQQVTELLLSPDVPEQCKTEVTRSPELRQNVLQGDVVALLRSEQVPAECKRVLSENVNLDGVSRGQVGDFLTIDGIPDSRKKEVLDQRWRELISQDIVLLLTTDRISKEVKEHAIQIPGLVERIDRQQAVALLGHTLVPDKCCDALLAKLPGELTLDDVKALLHSGKLNDRAEQDIVRKHLTGHADRILPFLNDELIPESTKNVAIQGFLGQVPEPSFRDLLALGSLSPGQKGKALFDFFRANKRLPQGCEVPLFVEEIRPEHWVAGPTCELFRLMNAKQIAPLIQSSPATQKNAKDAELCYLSLYITLFKLACLHPDVEKIKLVTRLGNKLVEDRRGGSHDPAGPYSVHLVMGALPPLLEKTSVPAPLKENLCNIASQVIQDLPAAADQDGSRVVEQVQLLGHPAIAALLDTSHQQRLRAWRTILDDLSELGQAWSHAKKKGKPKARMAVLNKWTRRLSARDFNQVRSSLLEHLHGLFQMDLPALVQAGKIGRLAQHFGVDLQQLEKPAESEVGPKAVPGEEEEKEFNPAFIYLSLAGGVILALVVGFVLIIRDRPGADEDTLAQQAEQTPEDAPSGKPEDDLNLDELINEQPDTKEEDQETDKGEQVATGERPDRPEPGPVYRPPLTAPTKVSTYVPLPDPVPSFQRGMGGLPAPESAAKDLVQLTENGGDCTLILHGLNDANRLPGARYSSRFYVREGPSRSELLQVFEGSSSSPCGKFFISDDNRVQFMWSEAFTEAQGESLRCLSACVLEVKTETQWEYVGLYNKLTFENPVQMTLENGRLTGEICLSTKSGVTRDDSGTDDPFSVPDDPFSVGTEFNPDSHPVRDFPLMLGYGKLHLDRGRTVSFGSPRQDAATGRFRSSAERAGIHQFPSLAQEFNVRDLSLTFTKGRMPYMWQFVISWTPNDLPKDSERSVAQAQYRRQYIERWKEDFYGQRRVLEFQQLQNQIKSIRRRMLVGDLMRPWMEENVRRIDRLRSVIEIPPLPPIPEQERAASSQIYRSNVEYEREVKQWGDEVERAIESALAEIEREIATGATPDNAMRAYNMTVESHMKRIRGVSAVLYRMVDGRIRTEDVVIGDP
jgi:hypothetical protein